MGDKNLWTKKTIPFIKFCIGCLAVMLPVLLVVYYRLSKREEGEIIELFGDEYRRYMEKTPIFVPHFSRST